jgi:enoyl-CoA hydratase
VTTVVPSEATLDTALELAARVAAMPPLAVIAAKRNINQAFELSLAAGLEAERRDFFLLFDSADQQEGMAAFVEKRPPTWSGR